jgi:hypothetical protein
MLGDAMNINKSTCHQLLREELGKQLNAMLVPHTLTQDQEEVRASVCADFLHEAQNDSTFVNSITAYDELWCFQYDPQMKSQSTKWWPTSSPVSKKVRRQLSETKTMIIVFLLFFMPRVLFITNLFRKSKLSMKILHVSTQAYVPGTSTSF